MTPSVAHSTSRCQKSDIDDNYSKSLQVAGNVRLEDTPRNRAAYHRPQLLILIIYFYLYYHLFLTCSHSVFCLSLLHFLCVEMKDSVFIMSIISLRFETLSIVYSVVCMILWHFFFMKMKVPLCLYRAKSAKGPLMIFLLQLVTYSSHYSLLHTNIIKYIHVHPISYLALLDISCSILMCLL